MSRRIQDTPAPHVAAIYCRVSSKQQNTEDKVSLETQEAEARKWCAAHGWAVDDKHVYREIHTGEDLWERRVLQELLADAKVRPFGLMLSHSVDRLSRDKTAVHLGIITDQLERAGVAFDFVTEAFESTPLGFLTMQIRGFAAGMENERRKERTMRQPSEGSRREADPRAPAALRLPMGPRAIPPGQTVENTTCH